MSQLVEQMFSVRQMPWHGTNTTILDEYPGSWAEARKFAGLEWEPIEQDVYRHPVVGGYRMALRIRRLDEAKPLELRAQLRSAGETVSETWSYILPGN